MAVRTDLAVERLTQEAAAHAGRITQRIRGRAFRITEITVPDEESSRHIGKPMGHYLTLEAAQLCRGSGADQELIGELGMELRKFLPKKGAVLVIGLGNPDITPDALGPQVAARILATRHLQQELSAEAAEDPMLQWLRELRPVSVLAGGVLGQTGIESAELVGAVCARLRPAAVLVVDALACAALERLGKTIQVCDSGICPGSGVGNHRREISARTLGIPVIALGVPTVIDLHTITEALTGQPPHANQSNLLVTPKDIDQLIRHTAELIGAAVNLALHETLRLEEIEALTH